MSLTSWVASLVAGKPRGADSLFVSPRIPIYDLPYWVDRAYITERGVYQLWDKRV